MTSTLWQREAAAAAQGIDTEHGLQVAQFDSLLKALDGAPGEVAGLLAALTTTSELHFGAEEMLLRQHADADYGEHVEAHRALVETLRDLGLRHARGERLKEGVQALRERLGTHMATLDQAFEARMRAAR